MARITGRVKSFFDGLGRLTKSEAGWFWNGFSESIPSNLINTANPDGKITTTYAYDLNSRLISIKDDNNKVTSFTFDNLNRQTKTTYPDASYRQVTYNRDSLGTLWEHRNNAGQRLAVSSQYDWLHRATQKDVDNSAATWVIGTKRQIFEFDGAGRVTLAISDGNVADSFVDSEVALAYNSQGKVLSETQTWRDDSGGGLLSGANTVNSDYDGVGFRRQVSYPNGRTVSFLPDELSRVERVVDAYTGTVKYDYLGAGRLLNRILPNGTTLTMLSGSTDNVGAGYDDARRLVDFASKLGSTGSDLARFAYGYDAAGNRRFERRVHEPSSSNWKGEAFSYDAVYRLTQRKEGDLDGTGALVGTASVTQEYVLDGAGNWKTHKRNASSYTQTINSLNQYTVFNGPPGQRSLYYDYLGNLTNEALPSQENQQYTYDFLNRLAMYLDTGFNTTSYRYDALGRRISKSFNGLLTLYVYDGAGLIEERDGSNGILASYLLGRGPDEVLSRRRWEGATPGSPALGATGLSVFLIA